MGRGAFALRFGAALALVSCADGGPPAEPCGGAAPGRAGPPAAPAAAPAPTRAELCAREVAALRAAPWDPEVAAYHAALPRIALKTRLVPVLYAEAPPADGDPRAAALRERLAAAGAGAERALREEIARAEGDRALLAAALLRDGYLFSPLPEVAAAFVKVLKVEDLFDGAVVFRDRGAGVERLVRAGDGYLDARGERADLLLNDRLAGTAAALAAPRHFDLAAARVATGAARVIPIAVAGDRAAVRLVYPNGLAAEAVLTRAGSGTAVACAAAAPDALAAATRRSAALRGFHERVRAAAARMVAERPGFDEPADELEGEQEDGALRAEWLAAYYKRERRFRLRDREAEYPVFDRRGNPTPPEVCIDFVFDTWERASGNWFRPRGERPGRTPGFLDFAAIPGLPRRHIPSILAHAAAGGPPLVRHDLPARDLQPLRAYGRMAEALARNADALLEGDVLVIFGLREEDEEEHYHAVLILEQDPISGLPIVVADNAGRPRIRSLAAAMRTAPRRSVRHRLRLDPDWLLARLAAPEIDHGRVVGTGARP